MIKHIKLLPELRGLILVVVAVAWMAGILLESWLLLPSGALLIGATLALVCAILLWRNSRGMLVSFIILWLLLGAWRYAIVSPAADPQAISSFIGTGKVDLRGTVADEPKFSDRSSLLQVAVSSISTNGGSSWQDAHGQLEVQISGGSSNNLYGPNYGDNVELQGKVQPPFPHHSLEVLASMIFPHISINGSGGNPILAALFKLRLSLAAIITQSLPQPMAAVLIAILLSVNSGFAMQHVWWCFAAGGKAQKLLIDRCSFASIEDFSVDSAQRPRSGAVALHVFLSCQPALQPLHGDQGLGIHYVPLVQGRDELRQ